MGWPYQQKPPIGWPLDWDNPINQGLAAYWPMLVGSGNTVTVQDLSGNGADLTAVGSPVWKAGKFGTAIDYGGSADYHEKVVSQWRPNDEAGTIVAWIKPESLAAEGVIFGSCDSPAANLFYFALRTDGRLVVRSKVGGVNSGGVKSFNAGEIVVNNWYQVVLTSDGSAYNIYINGIVRGLSDESGTNTGDWLADVLSRISVTIGVRHYSSANLFFNGLIDNVTIFNRALSASEIALLYRYMFWGFMSPTKIALLAAYTAGAPPSVKPMWYYNEMMRRAS